VNTTAPCFVCAAVIQTLIRIGSAFEVVDLPLSAQCAMPPILLYMVTHGVKPHRGCHWVISGDTDTFTGVAFRQTQGVYAHHVELLSSYSNHDWDRRCANVVESLLFWERCFRGFPSLQAVDEIPWEIHRIKNLTAHLAALEAYDQARP